MLISRPHSPQTAKPQAAPASLNLPELSKSQWEALVAPAPGEGDLVQIGLRESDKPLISIGEAREQAKKLDFLPIDPYVATVGCSISGERIEIPKGQTILEVDVPSFYAEKVEVILGAHNGPGAPMLVIFPGIHGSGESSHTNIFKKMALERGMNYLVIPNSLSEEMLEDRPVYHPGNPRVDALWTHELLEQASKAHPEYFENISIAGYSYGALQGANLIRLDEEHEEDRLIDGGLIAVSPPENLEHSMRQLDSLRASYEEGAGSIPATGLKYRSDVKKFGYERFLESELSQRGEGSNITEIKIADKYGSRDGLKTLIETVDTQFSHNLLPRNTQAYKDAGFFERRRLRKDHDNQVENITYERFSNEWMVKDRWLEEQHLTPTQMAERYSFSEAMKAIDDTPVLAIAAADDYILNSSDVKALRQLEANPGDMEVVKIFNTGGHVGLTWNPEIQNLLADFASGAAPLKLKAQEPALAAH